MIRTKEDRW